jgi:hypothetical protein
MYIDHIQKYTISEEGGVLHFICHFHRGGGSEVTFSYFILYLIA